MLQDSLFKLLSLLLCVVMLYIVPISINHYRQDQIIYNLVQKEVTHFSEQVRESGYMSRVMIRDFEGKLASTGLRYQIKYEHLEKKFKDDGTGFKAYYEGFYNDEILEVIDDGNAYKMNIGDFFFVTVESKSQTKSQSFSLMLGMAKGLGIYYTGGGVIRYGDT